MDIKIFPKNKLKVNQTLCKKIKKKYKIKKENFLGHSDIAPLRKSDPGENFHGKNLSKFKLGSWYKNIKNIKINIK